MKSFLSFLSLSLFLVSFITAQSSFFKFAAVQNPIVDQLDVSEYKLLQFNEVELLKSFIDVKKENENNFTKIVLPESNGTFSEFKIAEYDMMEPSLAAKFPGIKTYLGFDSNDKTKTIRITIANGEFSAFVIGKKTSIIEKKSGENYYWVFQPNIYNKSHLGKKCGHAEENIVDQLDRLETRSGGKYQGDSVKLRKYRFAVSTTGEYSVRYGGTPASVMAEVVRVTNAINGVYERDAAIRLILIANMDVLFNFDPATDPYTPGIALSNATENQTFVNSKILASSYDVGHVFGVTTGGGIVGYGPGRVCSSNKAAGSSNMYNFTSSFAIELVSHELGHQFSAGHSFNACSFDQSYEWSGHDMEPGSGSTIMSYSGSCGENNVTFGSDPYFHIISIEYITDFSRTGAASTCANIEPISNTSPNITILQPNGFVIPKSTPFELSAKATDQENDAITYCWEQFNSGLKTPLGSPSGDGPSFRSFLPTTSGKRVFPTLSKILNNSSDKTEVLPTYSRSFTFRVTTRDNRSGAGGQSWDELTFNCDSSAGPFIVTSPVANQIAVLGVPVEVAWDVARTNLSPINCKRVNIFLSTDNGFTITDTLMLNTLNDGSAFVTLPNKTVNNARIYVKSADNYFFNVSKSFITKAPTEPDFGVAVQEPDVEICSNNVKRVQLNSFSYNGFVGNITYKILETAPQNALITLDSATTRAGSNNFLTFDFRNVVEGGLYPFTLAAISGNDTIKHTISIKVYSSNFLSVATNTPLNGESGVSQLPEFTWNPSVDANSYIFQLATSPAFGDSIKLNITLSTNRYTPSVQLLRNTVYYWRIIPKNDCGVGSPTLLSVFQTALFACQLVSNNQTFNISQNGTPIINVPINIINGGPISDVNVRKIAGSHGYFGELSFKLIHPDGTQIDLVSNRCSSYSLGFNFGLDDQAPSAFTCPPSLNKQFKPLTPLSALTGKVSTGIWNLRVLDNTATNGGSVTSVEIEFCAGYTFQSPTISKDTLKMCQDQRIELKNKLNAQNSTLVAGSFKYTIVSTPQYGSLYSNITPLILGSTFTQEDINSGKINFKPSGTQSGLDQFKFVIEDASGGWKGVEVFPIFINACLGSVDINENNLFTVFPNPASEKITLQINDNLTSNTFLSLKIFGMDGKEILNRNINKSSNRIEIPISHLNNGTYLLYLSDGVKYKTEKILILK